MAGNEFPTEYDEIVLGTGLQESILAAALARIGHRVLHLDRNDYYSGDWASFHLNGLLDWIDKNSNDEAQSVEDSQIDESFNLLQEGERLVKLPQSPKTAFNIQVKYYVKEGNAVSIQERPIVVPSPILEPEPEANVESLPQDQQDANKKENDFTRGAESSFEASTAECVAVLKTESRVNEQKLQNENVESVSQATEEPEAKGDGKTKTPNENSPGSKDEPSSDSGHGSSENQLQEGSSGQEDRQEVQGAVGGEESAPTEVNTPTRRVWTWTDIKRQWRKFNMDLAPKLMFCRGSMVEVLVSSRISRYAEFKAVTRILTHINGKLEQVPCSRADVFSSKYVSMLEKRMLMRLIEFCLNYQNLQDEFETFKDKPFVEFLQSRRLTPTLQHFVIHSIAMVNATTPTEQALHAMQYFLRSLGRYGNTAFLWTLYGSGELPQCFCRMCAVFAGIYMLRNLPRGLILDSENNCKGIIDPEGRRLTCNHIIMEHSYVPPQASANSLGSVSRGILITDRSLKLSEYDEITFLTVPPPEGSNSNPVRVIELNWASCACPKDLFLVHLTCKGISAAIDDLQYALHQLFQPLNQDEGDPDSEKPKVLWSLFFNQIDATECDDMMLTDGLPSNALVTAGPGASVGFEHAVVQARRLFERICPGEEFLPPAPDPEDIIFEDPARDNPGEHKEVGFETHNDDNQTPENKSQSQNQNSGEISSSSSPGTSPAGRESEVQFVREDPASE